MKNNKKQGILVDGSIKSAGVTFFTRGNKTIARSSTSRQPKRRTSEQFALREGFAHSLSLWNNLSTVCSQLLKGRSRAYDCFMSLAAKLPPVFLTREENLCGMALLMPGIPVSCGTLTDIVYSLGEADGSPALLTDMKASDLRRGERLLLIGLEQIEGPQLLSLAVEKTVLEMADFTIVDGRLALVDTRYADPSRGWALVRCRGGLCSSQTVVTASTAYRAYQTDGAMQRAAASYGGLTG